MTMEHEPIFHLISQPEPDFSDPFAELEDEGSPPPWPSLDSIGLNSRQISARREGVGGSDANVVMSGDTAAILELWRLKRGETSPPDLSDRLPVMLGSWTEEFNRQWCERLRGKAISARGVALSCPKNPWRRCTLDGMVPEDGAIWEAKHTNAFASADDVLERYMPQLQHNMAVAGSDRAVLSVIFGNHRFEIFEIASDWSYQIDLLAVERAFWDCVQTGREPVAAEPLPPPRPIGTREVSMEGKNHWASAAGEWLAHREASKRFAEAAKTLKEQVEDDVARAFGHGVEIKRSRAGALTIREMAA